MSCSNLACMEIMIQVEISHNKFSLWKGKGEAKILGWEVFMKKVLVYSIYRYRERDMGVH